MKKISQVLKTFSQQWYFFPAIGVLFFLLINGGLFTFLSWQHERNSGEVAGVNTELEPSPSPVNTSPSPQPTLPSPTPISSSQPSPKASTSPSPKPSASPTPAVTPSPSPTPFEKEDVRIISPSHQTNYDSKSVKIQMEVLANREVEKLEIILNDSVKHTFTSIPYEKTFELESGAYQLKGKAYLKSGDPIESGTLRFGAGGTAWDKEATSSAN